MYGVHSKPKMINNITINEIIGMVLSVVMYGLKKSDNRFFNPERIPKIIPITVETKIAIKRRIRESPRLQ